MYIKFVFNYKYLFTFKKLLENSFRDNLKYMDN